VQRVGKGLSLGVDNGVGCVFGGLTGTNWGIGMKIKLQGKGPLWDLWVFLCPNQMG